MTSKREVTKRLKAIRRTVTKGETNAQRVLTEYETALDCAKVTQRHLYHISGTLDYLFENIERERARWAAQKRTRDEWAAMESQYIEDGAGVTTEDVYDDLMTALDVDAIRDVYLELPDGDERDRMRKRLADAALTVENGMSGYKPCAYVFCHSVFKPRRSVDRFCCDAHRKAQCDASKRFECTGTYLPEHAYIPKRGASVQAAYEKREVAVEPQKIFKNADFLGARSVGNVA